MVEELNMKNSLLSSEKEEMNTLIIEQAQKLTGTKQFTTNLYSWPVNSELINHNCFVSEIKTNVENTKQVEKDLTDERSRYQGLLSEHLHLEERHRDLKEKMDLSIVRNFINLCHSKPLYNIFN